MVVSLWQGSGVSVPQLGAPPNFALDKEVNFIYYA